MQTLSVAMVTVCDLHVWLLCGQYPLTNKAPVQVHWLALRNAERIQTLWWQIAGRHPDRCLDLALELKVVLQGGKSMLDCRG